MESPGIGSANVHCLVLHHNKLFAGTESGVWVLDSAGLVWRNINEGLPDITTSATLFSLGDELIAGQLGDLWLSPDDGNTWIPTPTGMSTGVQVLGYAAGKGELFAATSQGIWRSPLSEILAGIRGTSGDSPASLTVCCYPNPCATEVDVEWCLPRGDKATVTLYNILGQCVKLVTEGRWTAGTHTQWLVTSDHRSASSLP